MPKLSHKNPKYRRHSSRNIGFVEIEGRRRYLPGPYKSQESLQAYKRLCLEWDSQGRPSTPTPPPVQLTIAELVLSYWKHAKQYYVKNGQPTDEQHCLRSAFRHLLRLYGNCPVTEFRPLALKTVQESMVKADLARKTINEHVSRIRRLFKWGVEHELIPETCWRALHAVSGLKRGRTTAKESKPILPIEDTVVAATLPFLSATITAMVKLQRLTGMRPQEVCQIRPGDIDRTTETWRYTPQVHKTQHRGRERVIMIGPKAQEVLLPFLERPDDVFCFSPRETEDKRRELQHLARSTPIGYGNAPGTNRKRSPKRLPGACYSTGSYHKAIKRACEAAGIERWAPNRLRHSFATQVRAEAGIESARIL